MAESDYVSRQKPLKKVNSVIEALNYVDFAKDFVDANQKIP